MILSCKKHKDSKTDCTSLPRTEGQQEGLFLVFSFLGWGETESTWYVGHSFAWVIDDECGAVDGMRISRGNQCILNVCGFICFYWVRIFIQFGTSHFFDIYGAVYIYICFFERSFFWSVQVNLNGLRCFNVNLRKYYSYNLLLLISLLLFILTANGYLPGNSVTTIRHNTLITHYTQNNTTIKWNTAHKTTHTINTLYKMNTTITTTII
jgi:hypothetical protein